jgi:hypothetical protein
MSRCSVFARIAAAVLVALTASACGQADHAAGRLPASAASPKPAQDDSLSGPLSQPPEAYGLPPLDQFQADPAAVVNELFRRQAALPWTVKWQVVTKDGVDVGEFTLEHVPGKLHGAGTFGTPDTLLVQLVVLDPGGGARTCVQEGAQPWVCDVKRFNALSQIVSVSGFERLNATLLASINTAKGVEPQYLEFAGTAGACLAYKPTVMRGDTVGLDFSNGGAFCLSPQGALLMLDTAQLKLKPLEYAPTANPASFTLPV